MQKIAQLTRNVRIIQSCSSTLVYGNRNENTTHNFIHDRAKQKGAQVFSKNLDKRPILCGAVRRHDGCGCEARVGLGIVKQIYSYV